ncbi:MAG: hypothetical protein GQ574_10505 [Crocinitomix sp.]|nr:hypothetical protein [Crocinitomix sp.]
MKVLIFISFTALLCIYACSDSEEQENSIENSPIPYDTTGMSPVEIYFTLMMKESDSIKDVLSKRGGSILHACYEGTQNTAKLNFRNNGEFDIYWSTAFGNSLYQGTYTEMDNIYLLKYDGERAENFGNEILLSNGLLIPQDTSIHRGCTFYLGDCRGAN